MGFLLFNVFHVKFGGFRYIPYICISIGGNNIDKSTEKSYKKVW